MPKKFVWRFFFNNIPGNAEGIMEKYPKRIYIRIDKTFSGVLSKKNPKKFLNKI